MPERIYTTADDGKLEALEETQFSTEAKLQELIAEHPELLDGEQIRPGDSRRWILITREKGIAPAPGEAARWSVDHVIIDQDAVPTLAEVKRGSNPELRRTIVGQLLEYAAHASETWTAQELRDTFERQTEARGREPGDELSTLLQSDGEPDVDGFWEDVSTNLAAKRLRLLFVADRIPDPLAQVVSFLNAQMPGIEVLAVEIKRFHGKSGQTLVPRVIGRRSASGVRARGGSAPRLTRESFLEGFADENVRAVAERLLDAASESGGTINYWSSYGVSIVVRNSARERPIILAWLYSQPRKGFRRTRDFSFGAYRSMDGLPEEFRSALDRWVSESLPDGFAEDASSKDIAAWAVTHKAAVQHQDVLVERLRRIVSELASL